jgi:Ca-activated chloride channel family protein
MDIVFERPLVLWLLLLLPLLALRLPLASRGERVRNFFAVLGRMVACGLAIIGLAEPVSLRDEPDVSLVVAVDGSSSLPDQRREALEARARALVETVPRAATARIEHGAGEDGTDLSALLYAAAALAPPARTKDVLLLTDGAHTAASDPAELAQPLAAQGVRVFPILPSEDPRNVALAAVTAPLEVREGSSVDVTVSIESTVAAKVALEVDGGPSVRESVDVSPGRTEHALRFSAPAAGARIVRYAVHLDGSPWTDDDAIEAWMVVRSSAPTIVSGLHADAIVQALKAQGRSARAADWPPAREPGGTVIVSGPDVASWSADDALPLSRWVAREGGTLLLAGGPAGLGSQEPWWDDFERSLPVRFPDDKRPAPAPVALVYILDRSDSMLRMRKMELAKAAILQSLAVLSPSSLVGVLGFSDFPNWVAPIGSATEKDAVGAAVSAITLQGGTDIYPAVRAAGEALRGVDAMTKHAILLTDGQGLSRLQQNTSTIAAIAKAGITVSTVALSAEAETGELKEIARQTAGRFYAVRNDDELPKILVDETIMVVQKNAREEAHPVRCIPTSPICEGNDWSAEIGGLNQAEPRSTADLALVTADTDKVLLASWRYGLGTTAVLATELGGGWTEGWGAVPWLDRLLTDLERRRPRKDASLEIDPGPEGAAVRLVARDALGVPRAGLVPVARVSSRRGDSEMPLLENAPGTYTGLVPWDGPVLVRVEVPGSEAQAALALQAQASPPFPTELRHPLTDRAIAERIAAVTGGTIDPDPGALRAGVATRTTRDPLRGLLLLLAVLVLVVDVAVRRVPVVPG